MLEFFGNKTNSFIDLWSIEHILSGMSIGGLVLFFNNRHNKKQYNNTLKESTLSRLDILAVLLIAYLWESLELYMEIGLLGEKVKYWFFGVEHWSNRLFSDPMMLLFGYSLAKISSKLIIPARILSIAWLYVHIFMFPHSMYLHEIFLGG